MGEAGLAATSFTIVRQRKVIFCNVSRAKAKALDAVPKRRDGLRSQRARAGFKRPGAAVCGSGAVKSSGFAHEVGARAGSAAFFAKRRHIRGGITAVAPGSSWGYDRLRPSGARAKVFC